MPDEPKQKEEANAPKIAHEPAAEGEIVSPVQPKEEGAFLEEKEEGAFLGEKESLGSKIEDFLQEFNLSKKHIFYGIGCVVLLIILFFSGVAGFNYFKDWKKEKKQEQPQPPSSISAEIFAEETGVQSAGRVGSPAVISPEFIGETGISAAIVIGAEESAEQFKIASYIIVLRRLQNAYAVNIDELLNKAVDRRARLQSHIALLRSLREEGALNLQKIGEELDSIKNQYGPELETQEKLDENFFEQLFLFNAENTENILLNFTEVSKRVVDLRARFKALQKLKEFYEQAMPKLEVRIKDIELNKQALIPGIKVYDVPGSDLRLIVPVEGNIGAEDRLGSYSVVPLIPVHPSDVKTGKDFITQPGGGFR